MYRTYIHCTCTRVAYGQYERDLTTHTHLETFMVAFLFKILQFRVVMLLVVNIDTLTTSEELRHTRERERAWRAAETAEHRQERLTKRRERDRAGHSTLTAAAWICTNLRLSFSLLYTYTLQTCSILCVCSCYAAYATPIHHTTCSCLPHNALHLPSNLEASIE